MVAGANATNNGFNFDGYARGQANFIVPVGWGVEFIFSNLGSFPHSLAIASTLTPPVKEPLFGFGPMETGNAIEGIKALSLPTISMLAYSELWIWQDSTM
jgi:hypothetical protein